MKKKLQILTPLFLSLFWVFNLTMFTWVNVNGQTPAKPFGSNTSYGYGTKQTIQTPAQATDISRSWYTYWASSFIKDCGGGKAMVVNDYGGTNAYSEGQGYGMLLAAYYGDKATFDKLVQGYWSSRNSHGLMNWTASCTNPAVGANGATDGDLDAAMALLIANKQWPGTSSPHNYASLATTLINNIKTYEFVNCGGKTVQKAGDYLGGCNCTNPSYYATGYYRAFAQHVPGDAAFWTKAADDGLDLLLKATHPTTGLNPAWTDESGSITNGGTGDCNNIQAPGGGSRNDYQFDAARTPWRIVVDYLWWGTPKAKQYLDKITAWANTKGISQIRAGHKLDGTAYLTYTNSAFVGGFAIGAMGTTNQTVVNNFYKYWTDNSMHDQNYASGKTLDDKPYFQNSLRTMYHFVASGNFWNPYTSGPPTNQSPTVSITAPANNATFSSPATINITATAADADGTVSSVAFYNGTTLLGSDASSPYSYSWTNVGNGTYTITAVATDNAGATTTSTAITVVVSTPTNPPPTVSITSPANNATFIAPASITINATAADANGTVSNVEFYNGTTLLGSDNTSPYSFVWANVPVGTYSITVKATDNAGASTTSAAISVTVNPAPIPQGPYSGTPISIPGKVEAERYDVGGSGTAYSDASTANEGGQFRTDAVDIETTTDAGGGYNIGYTAAGEWLEYTVNVTASGAYNFSVRVASAAAGKSMHIEMGGVNVTGAISVPNTGGYQAWQTVTVPNINLTAGNDQIMRVVFDTDGINLNYVEVAAPVANVPPTVSVSVNNPSYTAPASITINATAADSDGTITNVQFYNGSTLLGSDATSPYSFVWSNVAAGTYQITARATDNSGATTTSSAITVVVNPPANVPPTVSVSVNNPSYTAPASITINATAADSDGSITNVEFFNGTTLLGSDATSPYSFVWSNVPAGTYQISAKATDNAGATTTSTVITVVVNPPANAPPSVSITSPANNSGFTAPASITIDATAADTDGTVSSVSFYIGNTLLGSDASAPYSFTWSNVAAGTYQTTARATDNSGATTTSTAITVVVNPPANVAPTVSITSPANNASFTAPASITIDATAADADGTISSVAFYNGTTLLGSDASAPYSFTWSNAPAGTYQITARATDNSGAVTISAAITVVVNPAANVAPTVSITSPANNASFNAPASITINATAADSDGSVANVEFYNGSTLIGSDASSPYSFAWNNVAAGTYQITAKATDNSGASTTSAAITVVVNTVTNNVPPTVSITEPLNGTSFTAPASITISANAADSDGSIVRVEFFSGSTLLGTDNTAPYSIIWNNVGAGSYVITAQAADNTGAITTSTSVNITVTGVVGPTATIQAETACSADGDRDETFHSGYKGTGYINSDDFVGASANWVVNSTSAQSVNLSIRYANPTADRPMSLEVNGSVQVASLSFASTGSGSTWNTEVTTVNLAAGANTIKLVALSAQGSPYLDELTFSSSSVSEGNCPGNSGTTIQAETACSVDGLANDTYSSGYRGTAYINSNDAVGASASWGVTSASAQTVSVDIRYAHNTAAGRAMSLEVNGTVQVASVPFASTGGPSAWRTETVQVNLAAGENTIKLVALTAMGSPYIDELVFSSTVTPSACSTTNPNPNPGNCQPTAVPSSSDYSVRNDWSDQYSSSGVSNTADAMKVTHRQWGFQKLWVVKTATMTIENGKTYTIEFDFVNDAAMPVTTIDIGLASSLQWNGPVFSLASVNVPGSSSKKTATFTANANGTVNLAIGLNWPAQVNAQANVQIKNLAICSSGQAIQSAPLSAAVDYETGANPFVDQTTVQINYDQTVPMQLTILDLVGSNRWESNAYTTNEAVYIGSGLPAGTYIVKAVVEGQVVTFRLIKN